MPDTVVILRCLRCKRNIEVVYEPGYAMTRDHPGEPDQVYSRTDTPDCDHEGGYTKEQLEEFEAAYMRGVRYGFDSEYVAYYNWG